jgi:hypothetical protein
MVDLGAEKQHTITGVTIYNRVDCCLDRLPAADVQVLDSSNNIIASQPILNAQQVYNFDLGVGGVQGRYVRVQKVEDNYLHLAEVQVMGFSSTPAPTPVPTIGSWDLNYASLTTNFNMNSANEITIDYNIGKGRLPQVGVFKTGCKEAITPATVLNRTISTSPSTTDSRLDDLKVLVDFDKTIIASSNIYDASTDTVAICLKVDLFSGSNVIKTDERDVAINLDFGNNFTAIADANLNQTSMGSNTDSTKVQDYIEACTCDGASTFNCNTDSLSPDDYLNVCIKSRSAEMEIDYLDELTMTSNDDGDKLVIVDKATLQDSTISSATKVPAKNGVHVASVIPSNFFSYSATSSAKVTGVVYLKLQGSRRRLAVDVEMIAGHPKVLAAGSSRALQTGSVGDQESAFTINVELKKNELGVAADANGATDAMMSGFIVVATTIGSAAAMMML